MASLKSSIERLASLGEVERNPEARKTFLEFRDALTQGKIRAAEKKNERWAVNTWVKQGILLGFRLGELTEMGDGLSFVDKDTFPARRFTVAERVRVVPGGSSVRTGSYVAPSVILRGRGHDGGLACAGWIVCAGWKTRASQRGGTDRRGVGAGERRARDY
jgi:2,3,4,5-tetrahydropyridine-2-carboxylate N-succinyltransferase